MAIWYFRITSENCDKQHIKNINHFPTDMEDIGGRANMVADSDTISCYTADGDLELPKAGHTQAGTCKRIAFSARGKSKTCMTNKVL
jgi:hypothetical protein